MNYTPNDLQNIEFKKRILGYNEDMVNDVLDRIIEDYSSYIKENVELKDKINMLNEGLQHYKNIEESLQNSLVVAQKAAEEVKKNAYDKADNIIREAEIKAGKMIDEAEAEVEKIKKDYNDTKSKMKVFKAKCESLIHTQLDMLREFIE